jgi:hypothetical protein
MKTSISKLNMAFVIKADTRDAVLSKSRETLRRVSAARRKFIVPQANDRFFRVQLVP